MVFVVLPHHSYYRYFYPLTTVVMWLGTTKNRTINAEKPPFGAVFLKKGGPSDRIRTCGILLPKQARYQLRYTRLLSFLSGWSYSPKCRALPTALYPDSLFNCGRVGGQICGQTQFWLPFIISQTARNPHDWRAFGGFRCHTVRIPSMLPNHPRSQLRHTRIYLIFCNFSICGILCGRCPIVTHFSGKIKSRNRRV